MRRKKPTGLSQLDTVTQNMGAVDETTKFLTINSAYGSNHAGTDTGELEVTSISESTKIDEELQYEDVMEVRKACLEKKNEFELSGKNSHDPAKDIEESFYDNEGCM
jgi:hypothetical protein